LFQDATQGSIEIWVAMLKQKTAKIDLSRVQSFNPDGMILRSLFHGFEQLAHMQQVSTVAHWPQGVQSSIIPADVLIGSRDDLVIAKLLDDPFAHATKACGGRLKGLIITNGKSGGEVITEQRRIAFASPSVEQIDATGAGDAFAAGVLEALTAGADLVEAAQHGAAWGSTSAGLIGSAEPRAKDTFRSWHRKSVAAG
ncbi:MAG: PfkB family carbohydrate kinase, partial [Pseudomonadota bacterium]